jgi:hypothetical protein
MKRLTTLAITALLLSASTAFAFNEGRGQKEPTKPITPNVSAPYPLATDDGKSIAAVDVSLSTKNLQGMKVYVNDQLEAVFQADRVILDNNRSAGHVGIRNSQLGTISRTLTFEKSGKYQLKLVTSAGGKLVETTKDVSFDDYGCDITAIDPDGKGNVKVRYEVFSFYPDNDFEAEMKEAKTAEVYINGILEKGGSVYFDTTTGNYGVSAKLSLDTISALSKMDGATTHIEVGKYDFYCNAKYWSPYTEVITDPM